MPLKYPEPKKEQCIIGCLLVLTWYQIYSNRYYWNLATRLWLWSLWFPGLSFCWETQSWTKRRWCGYLYNRAVCLFSETGSQPVWPRNRVPVCGNRRQYAMQQQIKILGVIYRPPNTNISRFNEKINCIMDVIKKKINLVIWWVTMT